MGRGARPTREELCQAEAALRQIVFETPLVPSEGLSRITGLQVFLKAENLQRTGSFKVRGASAKIASLPPEDRSRGVVAASAGNHGQGVALAARVNGIPATIVLPETAPAVKVAAIQALGARCLLFGSSYEGAYQHAEEIARSERAIFIHPFDDWQVIAGQGTVGLEICRQLPTVGAVVVPVGGGGLIAGVARAVHATRRSIRLIGVQAAGAAAMVQSFAAGRRVGAPAETVADGIKVGEPGEKTFQVVQREVDAMIAVEEEEIYRAVVFLLEKAKLVVEPAGAVAVAALLARRVDLPSRTPVVAIVSGGNPDPNLLQHFIEYGLVHSGRSLLLRARLPDRPGQLLRLLAPLTERRVNVLNIEHHRASWGLPVDVSEVLLHLETRGPEHCAEVIEALRALAFDVEPLLPIPPRDQLV